MYKQEWKEQYQRDRSYFEEDFDPFQDWDVIDMPGLVAESQLIDALFVLYGDGDPAIIGKFLSAAIEAANRAQAENKFSSVQCERGFPKNRGRALRTRAYATALHSGQLPTDDLRQASYDYETWCNQYGKHDWGAQSQAYLLNAARPAAIAGDIERFAALLHDERAFNWHEAEHGAYVALAAAIKDGIPVQDERLIDRFQGIFNRIRRPDFKPTVYMEKDIVRFELGAIWCKYFLSNGSIDWNTVIDEVSK